MSQPELVRPTAAIDRAWAILFARLVLGLIFFMAGVMKVFQLGPLNHARKYFLLRGHVSASLVALGDGRGDSLRRVNCRRPRDTWLSCSRGVGGTGLRACGRHFRTFATRAALRVSHSRDTAARLAVVCLSLAAHGRSFFHGSHFHETVCRFLSKPNDY
jgi:hypothetical protein